MHHPQEHVAGLLVHFLYVGFDHTVHGLILSIEVRAWPAARLVDRDHVIVFVKNVEHIGKGHSFIVLEMPILHLGVEVIR